MGADKIFNVLFVCMGNRVRSVMAEAILNNRISKGGISKFTADSAGLIRLSGAKAAEYTISVLADKGIDVSQHRSKQVGGGELYNADTVMTMEVEQREYLQSVYVDKSEKIFTLTGFAGGKERDIHDPFGESKDVYRKIFQEIEIEIDRILPMLISIAEEKETGK